MVDIGLFEVLLDVEALLCVCENVSVNLAILDVCNDEVLWLYALNAKLCHCSDFELTYGHILCDWDVECDELVHLVVCFPVLLNSRVTVFFHEVKVHLLLLDDW